MGKLTIGPSNALGSPVAQSNQVYVDRVQIIEVPVERIVEVIKEVPVVTVREVEKRVEVQVEVIKEIEKLVEVKIPYIQFKAPQWAKWAVLIAVVEALVIALLLEVK